VSTSLDTVMDEAIAWHLGLEQAGADEWHRFIAWLEASPAHQEAYDRLTLDDAALAAAIIEPIIPATSSYPVKRGWLRYGGAAGGLLAAAAAAWMALMPAVVSQASLYSVETAPGKRHSLTLADGTLIEMNGGTKLVLDHNSTRFATLERGEAVFHVVHHADQPFEVRSGGVTLQDVGTVFNVVRAGPRLRVAVAEGSVMFQPDREKLPLTKGQALAMREGDDHIELSRVATEAVGGWTGGRLDFRQVALSTVAEDVSRSTGAQLAVAPEMAALPFTGTLRLDRPSEDVMRNLAALAGAELRRDGPHWTIRPKSGGAH
jgi:transmembrane sensor